jgi:hypothetical protein
MDKLFGEVDHVEGGELDGDGSGARIEKTAYRELKGARDEESPVPSTENSNGDVPLGPKDNRL